MIHRDQARELMRTLDAIEADLRRLEHRCFAVRDAIGKAYGLKVGHYETAQSKAIPTASKLG